jgi:hypothetical protein
MRLGRYAITALYQGKASDAWVGWPLYAGKQVSAMLEGEKAEDRSSSKPLARFDT